MLIPPQIEIRSSPIHGLGVFAKQDIPSGYCLGEFKGIEYSLKDFKAKYGKDTRYTYQLGRQNKIICAKEERNFITYMNEAQEANCYLKRRCCWTARDIQAGEELFLCYDKKGVIKYPREYDIKRIN